MVRGTDSRKGEGQALRVEKSKFQAAFVLLLLSTLNFQPSTVFGQQPQAQSGQPLYAVNAKYVQGVGVGYWPTAGTGLVLNLAPGTAYCGNPPMGVNYAGGTLTLTARAFPFIM